MFNNVYCFAMQVEYLLTGYSSRRVQETITFITYEDVVFVESLYLDELWTAVGLGQLTRLILSQQKHVVYTPSVSTPIILDHYIAQ